LFFGETAPAAAAGGGGERGDDFLSDGGEDDGLARKIIKKLLKNRIKFLLK
jgi:hypothetical protein